MRSKEYTEIACKVVKTLKVICKGAPRKPIELKKLIQESSKCLELNDLYRHWLESHIRFTRRTITPNFFDYHDRFTKILIAGGMYQDDTSTRGLYFFK